MFDVYLASLKKQMKKMKFAKICTFAVKNGGVSSRGNPSRPFGSRGLPCFRPPPIFNLENSNLLLISFSKPFTVTVAVKQVNKEPFLEVCFAYTIFEPKFAM